MKYKSEPAAEPVVLETLGEDAPTRTRVAQSILEHGPSTAATLAERLEFTPAGIRRHLEHLVNDGILRSHQERVFGQRRRGRPAQVYLLTTEGRARFEHTYDDLASEALQFIAATGSETAVLDFARHRWAAKSTRYHALLAGLPEHERVEALAAALTDDGYPSTVIASAGGEQICQHHCPVANVAEQFPQLCEAEAEFFAELLGSHVQRLATIAQGDGVCTTHVPRVTAPTTKPRSTPSPERVSS